MSEDTKTTPRKLSHATAAPVSDAPDIYELTTSQDYNQSEGIFATIFRYFSLMMGWLLMIIPFFWGNFLVVTNYQRLVVFRLGKVMGKAYGPGLIVTNPITDTARLVDMRIRVLNVPPQSVMSKDSVTVTVDAVVFFHITHAVRATVCVENVREAAGRLAQTSLRAVVGETELDDILGKREQINERIRTLIEKTTRTWGIKIINVEIKDVLVPKNMQRVFGSQAEAERERRAKVINAAGEVQASKMLLDASNMLNQNKVTLQLRYLQTLSTLCAEKNSKIYFPIPMDLPQHPAHDDGKSQ